MKSVFSTLLLLFLCVYKIKSEATPCGDWEQYNQEKCIKILDAEDLENYQDAEKVCKENSSSLITIHFKEEEEFIINYLKKNKIADNVWIGMKFENTTEKYKWNDNTKLTYSNWAYGSPKNKSDYCVQLQTDESNLGKWSDVLCTKKNLVLCEKMQTWTLSHLQTLLLQTIKNPFPVGFTYVQLPSKQAPNEIWPWMVWKDITSQYAGLFFRAEGEGSERFGRFQEENSPHLINVEGRKGAGSESPISMTQGGWSNYLFTGDSNLGASHEVWGLRFHISGGEVRPRNAAIRVWERIE